MSDTFKQQVEEIIQRKFKHKLEDCETCKELWVCQTVVEKCTVRDILAAHNAELDRIAEDLPRVQIKPGTKDSILFNSGNSILKS